MAKLAMQMFLFIGVLIVLAMVFGLVQFNMPLQGGVQNIPTLPAGSIKLFMSTFGL